MTADQRHHRGRPPWIAGYQRAWLRGDLVGGLVTGAVVIPQAMAYASVAGLPPEVGLYTCMVPMALYALLGGGRTVSVSTTSTIAALSLSTLLAAGVAAGSSDPFPALCALTLLVGLITLAARLLHLGRLVDNVSDALLTGLKAGVGLTVAAGQIPVLLGIPGGDGGAFFAELGGLVGRVRDLDLPTVVLSVVTIAVLLGMRRWVPRIPGPLVAVVGGIAASALLDLPAHGVDLVDRVPSGLPAFRLPDWGVWGDVLPGALALALMAALETIVVARSTRQPGDPTIRDDGELLAIGVANTGGAVFGAMPAAGGFSQTAVAGAAGARSQAAGLVTVGLAVLVALLLGPVVSRMPAATLGAIVVVAVLGLVNPHDVVALLRLNPVEGVIALVAAVVALSAGMLAAVAVGVAATIGLVLWELDSPELIELTPDPAGRLVPADGRRLPEPGLLALRIGTPLYTANARAVSRQIIDRVAGASRPIGVVLLDATAAGRLSSTVVSALRDTGRELAAEGVELWLASLTPRALALLRRLPHWADFARSGRTWPTTGEALATYRATRSPVAGDPVPPPGPDGGPVGRPQQKERT